MDQFKYCGKHSSVFNLYKIGLSGRKGKETKSSLQFSIQRLQWGQYRCGIDQTIHFFTIQTIRHQKQNQGSVLFEQHRQQASLFYPHNHCPISQLKQRYSSSWSTNTFGSSFPKVAASVQKRITNTIQKNKPT